MVFNATSEYSSELIFLFISVAYVVAATASLIAAAYLINSIIMNEQENVKIVQEGYRLFTTGDIANLMNYYTDDIQYIVPGPPDLSPIAGRYVGKEQVVEFFHKVGANFDFSVFEPLEMIAQGDKVVALGHYQSTAKATGQPLNIEWVHVSQLRDGKVYRFQIYEDTATVVAALNKANVGVA